MIYADSSVLLSFFFDDPMRDLVEAQMQSLQTPLTLSPLVDLECVTSIKRKVGEGVLSEVEGDGLLAYYAGLLKAGLFDLETEVDEGRVWSRAMGLGRNYASSLKVRSLDIWHVAYALELGVYVFWSFDKKQRRLAELTGLKINP